jgi:lysophospholipase
MGGAIAADYLSRGKTPFKAAVLSAPMLTLNTKPYPRFVGKIITGVAVHYGFDESYTLGQGDFDPGLPFEKNKVTSSPERFWMSTSVFRANPRAVIGGASNGWVYRALKATPKIVRKMKGITTPVLLFQAGRDQLVKSKGQNKGCGSTPSCSIRTFGDSQHEVLMERDVIRDSAMAAVEAFFQ